MENFKNLRKQYVEHKQVLENLTGSIAADQLLLQLLEGLKQHVESKDTPDAKFQEFESRINFVVNEKELARAKRASMSVQERYRIGKDPFGDVETENISPYYPSQWKK